MKTSYFFKLDNIIQDYAWGNYDALETLFGIPNPHNKPQAEIWMGAHPNGCSTITLDGKKTLLSDFISANKTEILGKDTAERFAQLPYLFKVLSAKNALSVQVHPNKKQAEIGFAKEEKANIPLNASFRNYKDPNHKPELVYALTPYKAMNGFRPYQEILNFFHQLNIQSLSDIVQAFESNLNEQGLSTFFETLLSLTGSEKDSAITSLLSYANTHKNDALYLQILELAEQYLGDIGLFSPLLLNTVTLMPGEAMFLDACTPHAYINGTGLEIMANSDNVLRAGLTPKYIDVLELIACTRCQPITQDAICLKPVLFDNAENYLVPVDDFKFSVYSNAQQTRIETQSADILIAIDAPLELEHENGEKIIINKGESVFIPAYAHQYIATCRGQFARAFS